MNGFMLSVALTIFSCSFALVSEDIHCSSKVSSWNYATIDCINQGGRTLPFVTGLGKNLDAIEFDEDTAKDVWTADYLQADGKHSEVLCGFRYMFNSTDKDGEVLYGNCSENRFYICLDATSLTWQIYKNQRDFAVNNCNNRVNDSVLQNIRNIFKPGYYWLLDVISAKRMKVMQTSTNGTFQLQNYPKGNPFKCGAYSLEAGLYFRNCVDEIHSVCYFANPPSSSIYKSCSTEIHQSTSSSRNYTDLLTNDMIQSTSLSENTTVLSTRYKDKLLDESTASSGNITVTSTHTNDLGLYIGISVGIFLTLMFGVILGVFIYRRLRQTKRGNNVNSSCYDLTGVHNVPTKQTNAHSNVCFEPTVQPQSCSTECDQTKSKAKDENNTDASMTFYTTVYKENSNSAYQNDAEGYDVSSNFSKASISANIYNQIQEEDYDSTAHIARLARSENVYNVMQKQFPDNVYDTTQQQTNMSKPDDIYNQMITNDFNCDQDAYDLTMSTGNDLRVTHSDNTYDKLQ